jgi:hypothetical protein
MLPFSVLDVSNTKQILKSNQQLLLVHAPKQDMIIAQNGPEQLLTNPGANP